MNDLMLARLARKSQALSRYDFLRLSLSRGVRQIETQQFFISTFCHFCAQTTLLLCKHRRNKNQLARTGLPLRFVEVY